MARLVQADDLDRLLIAAPDLTERMRARAQQTAEAAFERNDPGARYELHRALYVLYEDNIRPVTLGAGANQYHPLLMQIRRELELPWERYELSRVPLAADDVPADPADFKAFFVERCATHPVVGHPLFAYLEHEAGRGELISFFLNDASLILRFCDLMVLSMIGADSEALQELAVNFWDEMGNGASERRHVVQFRNLLEYAGVNVPADRLLIDQFAERLGWQGLAGFNLYFYLALHRRNYLRSLGCLGAAEIMDPDQYARIVAGCVRVGLDDPDALAYYAGHTEMDVEHGEGWIDNVLLPQVARHPERRLEICQGAEMRMNAALDYYDDMLRRMAEPFDGA